MKKLDLLYDICFLITFWVCSIREFSSNLISQWLQHHGKRVDILISKNQALQILFKHHVYKTS